MTLQADKIRFIGRQTAPGGNHGFGAARQFLDQPLFPIAKKLFPMLFKEFSYGNSGARFNDVIGIQVSEMESIGGHPADGGFSRAHEPDQCEVANVPGAVHSYEVAKQGRKVKREAWGGSKT